MFRSFALLAATAIAFVASQDGGPTTTIPGNGFGKPLIGTDSMKNLHLNTSQRVLVNGKDLMATVELIQDLGIEVEYLRKRLAQHRHITRSPTDAPTTPEPTDAPTSTAPTVTPTSPQPSVTPTTSSPTVNPPTASPTPYGIKYNGIVYDSPNQTFTIQNTSRSVETVTVIGAVVIMIEAAGAGGGRGQWNDDENAPGAPGGTIAIKTTLSFTEPTDLYAFVSEMGVSAPGLAGGGGGSSDLRTKFTMPVGSNGKDKAFLDAFLNNASLYSRILVGGGGGGSHGGTYGYWGEGAGKSPGAGGPNKTCTNTLGGNDGGHVEAGASVTAPGQDGGQSIDSKYTGPGRFGMGGQGSDNLQYAVYTPVGQWTGMTWPNGGSGTRWANGGGGGGWYGGAGNWPNGGGGSNYAPTGDIVVNSCATNPGAGYLRITIIGHP